MCKRTTMTNDKSKMITIIQIIRKKNNNDKTNLNNNINNGKITITATIRQ